MAAEMHRKTRQLNRRTRLAVRRCNGTRAWRLCAGCKQARSSIWLLSSRTAIKSAVPHMPIKSRRKRSVCIKNDSINCAMACTIGWQPKGSEKCQASIGGVVFREIVADQLAPIAASRAPLQTTAETMASLAINVHSDSQ